MDLLTPSPNAFVPGALLVWVALVAAFTVLWLASLPLKNASIVDMWWGPAFVLAGLVYTRALPAWGTRTTVVLILVSLWAVRLAAHIGARNVGHGEDPRYVTWRRQYGEKWWWFSWVKVFFLQATVAWIVSWPLGAALSAAPAFPSFFDIVGMLLIVGGLATETIADEQLRRFKRVAARGQICDVGLWRYSRHPNYFGESVVWWGIFVVAAGVGGWATIVSPAIMTWLLLRVSGVTLLEQGLAQSKPGYAEYVRRTSAFVPWPPRA